MLLFSPILPLFFFILKVYVGVGTIAYKRYTFTLHQNSKLITQRAENKKDRVQKKESMFHYVL